MVGQKIAIVTVHGTGDTAESPEGPKWFQQGSRFAQALTQRLAGAGIEAEIIPHLWSGANSASEREKGADKLSRLLKQCAKKYSGVHIIGHSHGGNVANEAAVFLRWGRKVRPGKEFIASLITVGAPFLRLRGGWLQRLMAFFFFVLTWGSVVVVPLLAGAMWLATENRMDDTALIILFGAIGACLWFMFGISRRGARRLLRPRRSTSEAHSIYALWHENDEAISFLRRIDEVPIEAFPRASLFRSSSAMAISLGVFAVLIMCFLVPGLYLLGFDVLGLVKEAERAADASNSTAAIVIMLTFAPVVFTLTYLVYRFVVGGIAELLARSPLNNFVATIFRGIAYGRDNELGISDVSEQSFTHITQSAKLEGECATRMQAAAAAAADKLIDKYRWSLFTVGADTNAPLSNLATDAMTWDSLIHTTYFDQPEVAELIAAHIVGKARG